MMGIGSRALNIGRVIGAVGSSVPGGDAGVLAFIRSKAGTQIGIGAKQGMKYVGGPMAVASWAYMGYQHRHVPGSVYSDARLVYSELPELYRGTRGTKKPHYRGRKSTRGEHTVSSGTPKTRKPMRGGSAQRNLDKTTWAGRKTRSRASSNKPAGMISPANRRGPATSRGRRRRTPKALPYRKGGCPPGYRYDIRRKMCVRVYK